MEKIVLSEPKPITENKEIPDNSLVVGSQKLLEKLRRRKKAVFNTKHYQITGKNILNQFLKEINVRICDSAIKSKKA